MKYAVLYRKLIIDGEVYIQLFDKVKGKINNQMFEVTEGRFQDKKIPELEEFKNSNIVYQEVSKNTYEDFLIEPIILYLNDNSLVQLENPFKLQEIKIEFYKKYKDFSLIPEYDIEELIKETRKNLKKVILGQDEAINNILYKIYYNNILCDSDLSTTNILNNKNNILLLGPLGSGKTTLKEELKSNLEPIPIVECKLTGNIKNDITNIINKLLEQANNNLLLAMKGIVIYDGISIDDVRFNETSEEEYNIYLEEIKNIINEKLIHLVNNDEVNTFDMSYLTHMCIVDIEYENGLASEESIIEIGFNNSVSNAFNDEYIFMNNMTYDLAYQILKNKNISPLYNLKKVLESNGKTLKISNSFIDCLLDYGLRMNIGFSGINKILNLILKDKIFNKNIVLRKEDIEKLNLDQLFEDYKEEEEENIKKDQSLKVDIKKHTINGLTINDTVLKIKENIKGQDEAIFALVNAFYNHVFNKNKGFNKNELKQLKENVLFIGQTGVGKTAIVENLANIFNLTFVREIATRYSQTGYVGASVDDMLIDLYNTANKDIEKAQNGILYIDEIDKLASSGNDSMKISVQNDLLTLIEGDKRNIEIKNNPLGKTVSFDTSGLFIIGTGAFNGLDEVVKSRIKKESSTGLGFTTIKENKKINEDVTLNDLYEYGFDKQLIARFSSKIKLNDLQEDTILDIINNSQNGFINLVKTSYLKSGIKVQLSEEFKKKLATRVKEEKEGARGIKTIFSKIKNEIDKNINNCDIEEILINDDALDNLDNIVYVKKAK